MNKHDRFDHGGQNTYCMVMKCVSFLLSGEPGIDKKKNIGVTEGRGETKEDWCGNAHRGEHSGKYNRMD